jgi:hypothetical protein
MVYSAPINALEVFEQQGENTCQKFEGKQGICYLMRTSEQRRAESCAEMLQSISDDCRQYLSRFWVLGLCQVGRFCLLQKACNHLLLSVQNEITEIHVFRISHRILANTS